MNAKTTLQIETTRFGVLPIDEAHVLEFISPIIGFEQATRFVLVDHEEDSPFQWLQSLEDPELAFVVTLPASFGLNYTFELPEEAVQALNLSSEEDVLVLTLVTVPEENPALMTTNLLGPLVINATTYKALQVVLHDAERFPTKVRLLSEDTLEQAATSTEVSSAKPLEETNKTPAG
jgi:flagellar assembly factor FliW